MPKILFAAPGLRAASTTFFPFFISVLVGCGNNSPSALAARSDGDVQSFAADNSAGNLFVGFTGDDTGIPGVNQDLANVAKLFSNKELELNFGVRTYNKQTVNQIVTQTSKASKDMLTSPLSTLFWYISSHGAESGATLAKDKTFYFSEVAAGIRSARDGVPLQRLIVFFDTCFAGQNVDGDKKIDNTTGTNNTANQMLAAAKEAGATAGLAKEFIVLGASSRYKLSGDTPKGGVGSLALIYATTALKQKKRSDTGKCVTVGDWFAALKKEAGEQEPVMRVDPPELIESCFYDELPAIQQQ